MSVASHVANRITTLATNGLTPWPKPVYVLTCPKGHEELRSYREGLFLCVECDRHWCAGDPKGPPIGVREVTVFVDDRRD